MTIVKLKDGREFCGDIWTWRPMEGWFTLTDDESVNGGKPIRIELKDVESAKSMGQRVNVHSPPEGEDRDELARARREGWRNEEEDA